MSSSALVRKHEVFKKENIKLQKICMAKKKVLNQSFHPEHWLGCRHGDKSIVCATPSLIAEKTVIGAKNIF